MTFAAIEADDCHNDHYDQDHYNYRNIGVPLLFFLMFFVVFQVLPSDQVNWILRTNTNLQIRRWFILVDTTGIKYGVIATQDRFTELPSVLGLISQLFICTCDRYHAFVWLL